MKSLGRRCPRTRVPASRQGGFTLVELMVGVTIGLILVAGLALMFSNSSQSAAETDKSVRQIENGRYAMDALAEDISLAGYFDASPIFTTTVAVSPCAPSTDVVADLEAQRAASPPTLPFGIEGLTAAQAASLECLSGYKTGTPALIVRRLDTTAVTTGSLTTGVAYVQHSNFPDDLNAVYRAGLQGSDFPLRDLEGSVNPVRRYIARVYFLATCNDCGIDTVPTLKRAELKGSQILVAPVAEGIENIGFDFGFDTDLDGVPDQWLGLNGGASSTTQAAAATLGWGHAVAVRIHVVSRATEASAGYRDVRTFSAGLNGDVPATAGPFNDSYKRRAYVTTARANSIAGPREHP